MDLNSLTKAIQEAKNKSMAFLRNGQFFQAEQTILELFREQSDLTLRDCMNEVFECSFFRRVLRDFGHEADLELSGYNLVTVDLSNGTSVEVKSPYFVNKHTMGKRKRGPKPLDSGRKGVHLALDLWGFFGKKSPSLAFRGFRNAVICPSYETACNLLRDDGVVMSENWLRMHLKWLDNLTPEQRVKLSCGDSETLKGRRVVVEVDGGRYRERTSRKGRIPLELKRRGYDSSWREPRLFTIFSVDENGTPEKDRLYHVDGTTGDLQDFLELLEAYFRHLDIAEASEVELVSDGAPWIWDKVPELLRTIGLPPEKLTQLMDYTHAKQNLLNTIDLCSFPFKYERDQFIEEAKDLLFAGDVETLKSRVLSCAARGCQRKIKAKFDGYFHNHRHRFGYAQANGIWPLGSGAIESSVRRILNMRVKAPGSHWHANAAETVIFLRSKLLTGRWSIFRNNWLQLCRANAFDFAQEGEYACAG